MRCDLSDPMQRQIYFYGAYEPIESYLFSLLLQPGMVVVDAGANVGQYSLLAGVAVGDAGGVHAFEPVERNFERLCSHVRANNLSGIVHANRLALWWKAETLRFTLGLDQAVNCGAYTAGNISDPVDRTTCDAVTLDQYVRNNGITRLDVIKMDIEGAEWYALQGARETLKRWHPTLVMEMSRPTCRSFGYAPEQLYDFLKALGYQMWSIGMSSRTSGPSGTLPARPFSNVVFHTRKLPPAFSKDWTLRTIRTAQAMRGKRRPIVSLLSHLLTPSAERWPVVP